MGAPGRFTCAKRAGPTAMPVRARDFVYAWRRTVDPATASDNAQQLSPVVNCVAISEGKLPVTELGISAPDERTVRVQLNAPTPYLLSLLTKSYAYPQYEPAVRAHGEDWVRPEYIVSNGAFTLREYVIGGRVTPAQESALLGRGPRAAAGSRVPPARSRRADGAFLCRRAHVHRFVFRGTDGVAAIAPGRSGGERALPRQLRARPQCTAAAVCRQSRFAHGTYPGSRSRDPGALRAPGTL